MKMEKTDRHLLFCFYTNLIGSTIAILREVSLLIADDEININLSHFKNIRVTTVSEVYIENTNDFTFTFIEKD